ncbi:MAG TPA: aminotransferase class V-fold PLP-dependent enzyme, partial [Desulfobacterales bacterium]|nr:aminotransferase class V-fold PLP-dependent enzyme [Desulfobacterales bacterium]
ALASYERDVGARRDRLEQEIARRIPGVRVNGRGQPRLANTLNVSFRDAAAAAVLQELDEHGVAVSAHAACHGGDLDPSHVLAAMRVPEEYIHGTMRISLSRYTTDEEIERFLDLLPRLVARSRRTAAG